MYDPTDPQDTPRNGGVAGHDSEPAGPLFGGDRDPDEPPRQPVTLRAVFWVFVQLGLGATLALAVGRGACALVRRLAGGD